MGQHKNALTFLLFLFGFLHSEAIVPAGSRVLVLGSGGLIGTALTELLTRLNYQVVQVKNRNHVDLRIKGSLSGAEYKNISFVFFLACEVGGSKFIDNPTSNVQVDIIRNNLLIYETVFDYLSNLDSPPLYLFTSSYLQSQPTSYGTVKRLGEAYIRSFTLNNNNYNNNNNNNNDNNKISLKSNIVDSSKNKKELGSVPLFGKTVRLWNIYGPEKIGPRSHVVGDWIMSCLSRSSHILSLTDGREARQFLHVNDTALALVTMMNNFEILEEVTDLSSNEWITMKTMATLISKSLDKLYESHNPSQSNKTCSVAFSEVRAIARARLSPKVHNVPFYRLWKPNISLQAGIDHLYQYYYYYSMQDQTKQKDSEIVQIPSVISSSNDSLESANSNIEAEAKADASHPSLQSMSDHPDHQEI